MGLKGAAARRRRFILMHSMNIIRLKTFCTIILNATIAADINLTSIKGQKISGLQHKGHCGVEYKETLGALAIG